MEGQCSFLQDGEQRPQSSAEVRHRRGKRNKDSPGSLEGVSISRTDTRVLVQAAILVSKGQPKRTNFSAQQFPLGSHWKQQDHSEGGRVGMK